MSEELQVFKSSALQWIYHHNAYDKEEVKNIPNNYTNFSSAIKDCNTAIYNSGLNGVSVHGVGPVQLDYIFAKPYDGNITKIQNKISNLNSFCSLIHEECRQKIDYPFKDSMSGLLESVGIHSAFSVSCGEGFGEIDITQIEPEEIRQWLESQMSMFDEDSQFLTGDDNVDYYVKYYSQRRDGQYGRYNYEYALENWDNLTYTQKKALYHIYEYSVRQCEKDLDGTSATYKNCKDRVDRMSQYLFTYYPAAASMYVGGEEAYFNETSICKDMAEIAGKKEFSHSFQMFDDIINCDIGQLLIYYEDGQVVYDTTRGIATTEPDVINLSFEGYKAGMRLVLNYSFASPEMEGCCGSQEVSYYVPQARAYAYVKNEAKKNPGVYDHQEELGLSQSALSIFLMCSRSSGDMDVLDNMTKSHGQSYTEIFTAEPNKITSSGATAIVMYNNYLSQRYFQFGDEKCRQEAARMNEFLMKGEEQYSQEYSNAYNAALYYMYNPDAAPDSKVSILEAFGRGMESEIAVWPTALYTLAVNSDKDNVNYYGFAAMKGIGPIENNMDSYSATKMRDGEIKDYSIQQRLSYYQYMADNNLALTTAEQNDLRDIYYSYLEYVQNQRINLYVTQSDEDRFNELALLMKSLDSNYAGLEFWNDQNSKIAKAGADHPVAFSVGKIAGDTVIYLAWDVATGGLGAAAGVGVESFAGKVFTATVADVIIKDLPKSLLSYANGEDIGDIALDFTKEVAFDVAGNAAGEVIGNTLGNVISTKKGKELVKQFDEAIDQNAFLKNLAPGDVGLMVAQMDYKKAADVLGNFSDDTVKSIIGGLPEYSAKSIAGNMMTNADDVTKAAIIKSLKPADAFDAFSGLANESKAAVLGNLDKSTADALSKSYYETVSNFGDMNDAVKIISQRTDITDVQKIDELHKLFDNSPYKTDVNIPSDVQYVKEFTKDGVVYDWPELYGFNESTIRAITREDGLPDVWDRYGYMGGSNFADMPSAGRYTYGERAIPYLENEAAYHCGTFNNKSYFDKIDAIRKGDIDSLNGILKSEGIPELSPNQFDEVVSSYRKGIVDIKANIKNYSGNVDVTYGLKGNANKWGDMPGGAGQYITPFNGNDLKKLGILQETSVAEAEAFQKARGLATEIYKNACNIEASTTSVMKSLEVDGAHLVGLDNRLKTPESIQRKILSDSNELGRSLETSANNINDSLRYTLVSSETGYTKMVAETIEKLEKQGFIVEKFKNTWGDDIYQGINVVLKTPEGNKFELQFHTEASFSTKETLNHKFYEIARNETASITERNAAIAAMKKNQENVRMPFGAEELSLKNIRLCSETETIKNSIMTSMATDPLMANAEVSQAILDVGKKAGYSEKTLKKYITMLDNSEISNADWMVKKQWGDKADLLTDYDLALLRDEVIAPENLALNMTTKKLLGLDTLVAYNTRYNAGVFDKKYSLDDILEFKMSKNAAGKKYSDIVNASVLPRADEFISEEAIIRYTKELLHENPEILKCNTLQELADEIYKSKPEINLVVFQSGASDASNILYWKTFGDGRLSVTDGGGIFAIPEYRLSEFAERYSSLCGLDNGKFVIYDYENFGSQVLSGVTLNKEGGALMITTTVPFNGTNLSMPSVNNSTSYLEQFVSGGRLLSGGVEITEKTLPDLVSGASSGTDYLYGSIGDIRYTIRDLK